MEGKIFEWTVKLVKNNTIIEDAKVILNMIGGNYEFVISERYKKTVVPLSNIRKFDPNTIKTSYSKVDYDYDIMFIQNCFDDMRIQVKHCEEFIEQDKTIRPNNLCGFKTKKYHEPFWLNVNPLSNFNDINNCIKELNIFDRPFFLSYQGDCQSDRTILLDLKIRNNEIIGLYTND